MGCGGGDGDGVGVGWWWRYTDQPRSAAQAVHLNSPSGKFKIKPGDPSVTVCLQVCKI